MLCGDDIVGGKASAAHEEKPEVTFLIFPLTKVHLQCNGVECDAVALFEVIMQSRGNAAII